MVHSTTSWRCMCACWIQMMQCKNVFKYKLRITECKMFMYASVASVQGYAWKSPCDLVGLYNSTTSSATDKTLCNFSKQCGKRMSAHVPHHKCWTSDRQRNEGSGFCWCVWRLRGRKVEVVYHGSLRGIANCGFMFCEHLEYVWLGSLVMLCFGCSALVVARFP